MLKITFVSLFALAISFAATTPGCSTVELAYDCDQICDRYQECFDADYDAGQCASECRANAGDEAFGNTADECEACIDDRSCTGSFSCVDECIGIVP
jgi:hypothetical protein